MVEVVVVGLLAGHPQMPLRQPDRNAEVVADDAGDPFEEVDLPPECRPGPSGVDERPDTFAEKRSIGVSAPAGR